MNQMFQQNPRVEAAPLNEEAILFDPSGTKFFMLNSTSSCIWELLATPNTAESLADQLCNRFDKVSPGDALNDVQAAIKQMLAMELIVAKTPD